MSSGAAGHGARNGSDVERIARRDEDDIDAVALLWRQQEMIVERNRWYTLDDTHVL